MQSGDDFRHSFRDALAARIGGTGLEARFDVSDNLSWVPPQGGGDNVGYGIGCGLAQDPALPDRAWPTYLSVTYYTSVDCPPASCEASASSTSPWQAQALVMPGSLRAPP
jgi:hypothetical protein